MGSASGRAGRYRKYDAERIKKEYTHIVLYLVNPRDYTYISTLVGRRGIRNQGIKP
jgi:hypothetical protein